MSAWVTTQIKEYAVLKQDSGTPAFQKKKSDFCCLSLAISVEKSSWSPLYILCETRAGWKWKLFETGVFS